MTAMKLGVIFGGRSVEHEVSVVSAIELIEAADPERFDVVPFGVTRDGRWLTPDETRRQLDRDDPPFHKRLEADVPRLLERGEIFAQLSQVDVLFPLVHGVNGEDGTLQGMLEMFGLPYAGCGVAASAIGMDKGLQKHLLTEAGIEVAPYIELREGEWRGGERNASLQIEQAVGYPAFVKPANGGSSVGVSKVRSREDLDGAMASAFAVDGKVLVEQAIRGREVECGIIGGNPPEASPVGEVLPAGEFYDYTAKYLDDSAQLVTPADLDEATVEVVQETAVEAFEAIDGGAGFARIDFFLEKDGHLLLNEINTIPGFRPVSMFPRLWQVGGLSYRDLISKLVDLALGRFREKEARGA